MNKALYDVKWIKNKRRRINMAVISNREAYLASEPEMDITQFHKTALDLNMQTNQKIRYWTSSIRKTEKVHIHW